MAIVQLSTRFTGQLGKLKAAGTTSYAAANLSGQRQWLIPDRNGWSGSPFDIQNMSLPFARTTINSQYISAVQQGSTGVGKITDLMAASVQVDYLSMQERAFRARHMSPIRDKMHSANRRRGHGTVNGIFDMVERHVMNTISAGA